MAILVDTTVLYERENKRARNHEAAKQAVDIVLAGRFGTPVISDYIVDETVTLALARTGRHELAIQAMDRLLGRGGFPQALRLRHVETAIFDAATRIFETYPDQGLSFTDATTVALAERFDIERVLSFDDDFDGLLDRVDPRSLSD